MVTFTYIHFILLQSFQIYTQSNYFKTQNPKIKKNTGNYLFDFDKKLKMAKSIILFIILSYWCDGFLIQINNIQNVFRIRKIQPTIEKFHSYSPILPHSNHLAHISLNKFPISNRNKQNPISPKHTTNIHYSNPPKNHNTSRKSKQPKVFRRTSFTQIKGDFFSAAAPKLSSVTCRQSTLWHLRIFHSITRRRMALLW